MEGSTAFTGVNNRVNHGIQIVENVTGWNAERPKTKNRELAVARAIPRRLLAPAMRFAIDLDRQPRGETCEVQAVGADRMLPTELEAARSAPKSPP